MSHLIPMKGFRSVYTRKEVEEFTGLTKHQIHEAVRRNKLACRGKRPFSYLQKDVNAFIVSLNKGEA